MKYLTVVNPARDRVLGSRVGLADRWWRRAKGLLGRRELEPGEGMLLDPCRSVHMFGMAFPLDVAFLDQHGRVVALYPRLHPGARTRYHPLARRALELPAGTLADTHTVVGDLVVCSAQEVA